jgi:hypothetical protein
VLSSDLKISMRVSLIRKRSTLQTNAADLRVLKCDERGKKTEGDAVVKTSLNTVINSRKPRSLLDLYCNDHCYTHYDTTEDPGLGHCQKSRVFIGEF